MWRVGNYTVLGRIARGSTADVLVALDPRGRRVVLKRLFPHRVADDAHMRMFLDEVRLQASLRHDHIASVIDLDEDEDGPFAVLELVDGPTLSGWLRLGGPLSAPVVSSLAAQLLSALVLLERNGIVHRDISPQNIVIDRSGTAKLIDFGVARPVGPAALDGQRFSASTTAGSRRGRWRYQPAGVLLDPSSDVFGLGLCLLEARIGTHALIPPDADDAQAAQALHDVSIRDVVPQDAIGRHWLHQLPRASVVAAQATVARDDVVAEAVTALGLPSLRLQ